MADETLNLGASESGINNAIADIQKKKEELETAANGVATAFTTATGTIQLEWLNRMISEEWNINGVNTVNNAKAKMSELMTALDDIKNAADEISHQ